MKKPPIDEEKCCGCGACAQACPGGALAMLPDAEGFLRPVLDAEKCSGCGRCEGVCPMLEKNLEALEFGRARSAIAAVLKDAAAARESSSGGAFSALAEAFGECNAYFGAEMEKLFDVVHRKAENLAQISAFRKSKYIPSDTKNTFCQAREILESGGRVLYSGTPCQIAALKLFVGEKLRQNLFCIDFSCHGTASPLAFKKYISCLEKKYGKKIKNFHFRAKARFALAHSSQSSKIIFEDGSQKTLFKDPWFGAFVAALFKRPSCKFCPFSKPDRVSDATIADFWGIERISKNWDSGRGVSLVLLNTQKSKELMPRLKNAARCEEFAFEECLKYNVPLREKIQPHPQSEKFKRLLLEGKDFEKALAEVLDREPALKRACGFVLGFFPARARHKIASAAKKSASFVKNLLSKILPKALFAKVMRTWAGLNARKYDPEKERESDD